MMKPKMWFVFDVESVGLHGDAFAVGVTVVDAVTGDTLEEMRECKLVGPYGRSEDKDWVAANVPCMEITARSDAAMRDNFWRFWEKWKAEGAVMAADCAWPVEARFLVKCVDDFPESRNWAGPYPLVDISSVLLGIGADPIATFERLEQELPAHDPLCDARQSARILLWALATRDWMKNAALVGLGHAGDPPCGVRLAQKPSER